LQLARIAQNQGHDGPVICKEDCTPGEWPLSCQYPRAFSGDIHDESFLPKNAGYRRRWGYSRRHHVTAGVGMLKIRKKS
jgi:hypothetical protein